MANELPIIAAYGEADISLHARADLMGGISLLGDLINQPNDRASNQVEFELNAEIDLGTLYPMVRVQRSGVISLQ